MCESSTLPSHLSSLDSSYNMFVSVLALWFRLALFTSLASLVKADPELGFPFSEQLPTVGRVGDEYGFTISTDTFKSDNDEDITYSASGMPSWLKFDASSLKFSGTPTEVTTVSFTLTGNDSTGSTDEDCEIVVTSGKQGVTLKGGESYIYSQLADHGETNGYDGLVLEPDEEFTVKFENDTFTTTGNSTIVAYYGTASNRTSLPSWIEFDETTLTFTGTAPVVNSVDAPSQEWGFLIIATDVSGYAAASGTFSIVVGGHYLVTTDSDAIVVNGTAGKNFSSEIPLDRIKLDDYELTSANISYIDVYEGPDWVSIDGDTLKGNIPSNQTDDVSLNITIADVYGDTVYVPYKLDVLNTVFTTDDLPEVNATRSKYFNYQLASEYFTYANSTKLNATSDADWLDFHSSNRTFNGWVPSDFDSTTVTVSGTMDDLTGSEKFKIEGVGSKSTTTSSTSSTSATSSASSTSSSTSSTKKSGVNKKKLAIGLGVGLGCLFLLALLALLLVCCCRRRKDDDDEKNNETTVTAGGGGGLYRENSNTTLRGPGVVTAGDKNFAKMDDVSMSSGNSSATNVGVENEKATMAGAGANIQNSWRNNNTQQAGWKPHDSLSSLATVTTNDLLTVNVIDDPNLQRRSQMNLFLKREPAGAEAVGGAANHLVPSYKSSGRMSGSLSSDPSSNIELLDSSSSAGRLPPIRDMSGSSGSSSSAKLVEFTDKPTIQNGGTTLESRSYQGVIEN